MARKESKLMNFVRSTGLALGLASTVYASNPTAHLRYEYPNEESSVKPGQSAKYIISGDATGSDLQIAGFTVMDNSHPSAIETPLLWSSTYTSTGQPASGVYTSGFFQGQEAFPFGIVNNNTGFASFGMNPSEENYGLVGSSGDLVTFAFNVPYGIPPGEYLFKPNALVDYWEESQGQYNTLGVSGDNFTADNLVVGRHISDLNADGDVDGADAQEFVYSLMGSQTVPERFTYSDVDGNGSVDGMDIQPFIDDFMTHVGQ